MILDSDNSENIVAKKLVTMLNLKARTHLNPYNMGWGKKGGEVVVNEICTITLSIGSEYKDQIICDITEIDVCHHL